MRGAFSIGYIVLGSLFIAIATNWLFVPSQLIGGGVNGVAMLIHHLFGFTISLMFFILNIPLLIWALLALGASFVQLTLLSVIATSAFIALLPPSFSPFHPALEQPLAAIFGGIISGAGVGLSLRVGGSSGGFDILGAILTKKYDTPIGPLLVFLNALVLLAHGALTNWNAALWSLVSIYASVKIIETIHIKYSKVTAWIVTTRKEQVLAPLLTIKRGVTILHSQGAFTKKDSDTLMTVTTRYELPYLKRAIKQADPNAFINIIETSEVFGTFRKG
jgi:uncharacterized membrane-anchored protein YitT (DUF2179 family)